MTFRSLAINTLRAMGLGPAPELSRDDACTYALGVERKWGIAESEVIRATLLNVDGSDIWEIWTTFNQWGVWREQTAQGLRIYGEC